MNDRTSTDTQHDQPSRYDQYTDTELNQATVWLRDQGQAPWLTRFKIEGDVASVDMRGIPPIIRHMLRESFGALELMDAQQISRLLASSVEDRATLTHQVLTEAGR